MSENIDLILRVKDGDGEAYNKMCNQYKNLIDSMSRKYSAMCTVEYSVIDDFRQEAEMAFYKAIMMYDVENSKVTFGAYAKVCIRNRLISCVRRYSSQKRKKGAEEARIQEEEGWSLQDTVIRRELGEKLMTAADSVLSDYEKLIFAMYLRGKRASEIAQKLGRGVKSVNNAIYRIRLKLKRIVV
ncbi:MAG: sigma-70 family RNA polymerase sigma factor [Clostridia bacterium]|nr:sigma-70 family RNA polymerase sigma factor [Clostridia bacterium]